MDWLEALGVDVAVILFALGIYALYRMTVWRKIQGMSAEYAWHNFSKNLPFVVLGVVIAALATTHLGLGYRAVGLGAILVIILAFRPVANQFFGLCILAIGAIEAVSYLIVFWPLSDCSIAQHLNFTDGCSTRYTRLGFSYGLFLIGLISLAAGLVRGRGRTSSGH